MKLHWSKGVGDGGRGDGGRGGPKVRPRMPIRNQDGAALLGGVQWSLSRKECGHHEADMGRSHRGASDCQCDRGATGRGADLRIRWLKSAREGSGRPAPVRLSSVCLPCRRTCGTIFIRASVSRSTKGSRGAAGAQVPYKHKVGGSNPSATTRGIRRAPAMGLFSCPSAFRAVQPRRWDGLRTVARDAGALWGRFRAMRGRCAAGIKCEFATSFLRFWECIMLVFPNGGR